MGQKGRRSKKQRPSWELLLPYELAGWLPSSPWLSVKLGGEAAIQASHRRRPVTLVRIPPSLGPDEFERVIAHVITSSDPHLVISRSLKQSLREHLERRGTGYLDSRGHLHLVAPDLLIHLGGVAVLPPKRRPGESTLGVHGVRAVQALLDDPGPISLTPTARRVQLSVAQVYNVLRLLERATFVRSSGRGPAKRRSITDRTQLLDWLARQPAATRREVSVDAALYARKPEELWAAVTSALARAQIEHALTGAAAASLFGVGPTSIALSRVRIDPAVPLEEALAAIGAERTERAPNLRLIRDTGMVGVIGDEVRQGARVAPKIRVYLDCLAERRGEDIAEQFRERVLGY